jgi:serine/threonine protein kinase
MCNGNLLFNKQFDRYDFDELSERERFLADVRRGSFPCRRTYLEHIPSRIRKIIRKCLEPNPRERFQSAIDVANELAQIDEGLDWQYEDLSHSRSWSCDDSKKQINLIIDAEGNALATKLIYASGRTSRITAFCKKPLSSAEISRFFREHS